MLREYTCVFCPRGCRIEAEIEAGAAASAADVRAELETTSAARLVSASGHACPRGLAYVAQEIEAPRRTIASSVRVVGGSAPIVSVRLTRPIPRSRIGEAMAEIRRLNVDAPVEAGRVLAGDLLGLGSPLLATRSVACAEPGRDSWGEGER